MKKEHKILGLDIGPNSVGWALLNCEKLTQNGDAEPIGLIATGVRVFAEGVDKKDASKNAARRAARSARRTHQRRNRRRDKLKSTLQAAGLAPIDTTDINRFMANDPITLRGNGLDTELSLHEFGRVLYHLGQRRGFKSNRKSVDKKDDGVIKQGISALNNEIQSLNCRTLGEYLSKLKAKGVHERLRGRHTHRDMLETEFHLIWDKQSVFHPTLLTEELRKNIHTIIFFQRHFDIRERWGRNLENLPSNANARRAPELGRCEYEKDKRRSPRANWHAMRFRLLQDVNNMLVTDISTGEERALSGDERARLIYELGQSKELAFDKIRKLLGLTQTCKFNLESEKRAKLKGNSTEWHLRQAFKKNYGMLKPDLRDETVNAILEEEDEAVLRERAKNEWGLDEKGIDRLLKSELESGYIHLSVKALKKLLPHLELGKSYMEAVEAAGYLRRDQRNVHATGRLNATDLPKLTNPLVATALHQVRKVVNAIVKEHGVPYKIRVEMARDLKIPISKRKEIIKEQKNNEAKNENAKKRLMDEFAMSQPSRDDIIKYRLWEECDHECPYTGKAISKEALFSEVEVEHIIPFGRSMDDSYMNKTLCFASENRLKLNRTPTEHYAHKEADWDAILKRVQRLPEKKQNRFYMKEIPDDFINRQLTDTAHIATEVRTLLEKVSGKDNVQVTNGRATATLRWLWGLQTVLGTPTKNRADHRHHAIDAIVVALTSPGMIRRLSKASASQRALGRRDFPAPWKCLREDARAVIDNMVVSHRVARKISGALHDESNYGILQKKDENGTPLYAIRKFVTDLKSAELKRIADARVRDVVFGRLREYGIDPDSGDDGSHGWKRALSEPLSLPNRNGPPIPLKKVRLHRPGSTMLHLGYRAVAPGSNHHIVIFEYAAGDKKGQWDGEVVSMFTAAERLRKKAPVIDRRFDADRLFIMSLSINETIRVILDEREAYYRVQMMSAGNKQITFRMLNATNLDNNEERLTKYPWSLKGLQPLKVTIDPLGRVCKAND